jgi:hypothetical protein
VHLAPYRRIDHRAQSVALDLDEAWLLHEPQRDRLCDGFAHPLIARREAGRIER